MYLMIDGKRIQTVGDRRFGLLGHLSRCLYNLSKRSFWDCGFKVDVLHIITELHVSQEKEPRGFLRPRLGSQEASHSF